MYPAYTICSPVAVQFYYSILDFYNSILDFYYSILDFYRSIIDFYYSMLAFYYSILAFYDSILAFITRYSPFITRYSPFITRYSPFITRYCKIRNPLTGIARKCTKYETCVQKLHRFLFVTFHESEHLQYKGKLLHILVAPRALN